ncbi:MAG TPA: sulfotransferase [Anaerolineales bacterium]|nr:sulfotransferase [Anaerolineales bacterium]
MDDHHFIFVCGLHRSGTSILFRSLRDHPKVSGFLNTVSPEDEGMHLQSVYYPSGHYGGAGEFGFHREAHLTESSPLVSESNRNKLFREWAKYWDLTKPYLLEKSPPNVIRTRFLQAMFPNSSFIVLVRHPLAVTYATWAWYRFHRFHTRRFARILEHWLVCHELFLEDRKHLKNVLLLKYEEFVADPNAWVNRINSFLRLDNHQAHQKILSNVNKKYFGYWSRDLKSWHSSISTRPLIARYEDRFKKFGYSLIDLDQAAAVEL